MEAFDTFQGLVDAYEDTLEFHTSVRDEFFQRVMDDSELFALRKWILANKHGYGETQFYWMWNLIVKELPQDFKFLEIGVYRGQILCLATLLARRRGINGTMYGVTALSTIGFDGTHPGEPDFESDIARTFDFAKQPTDDFKLIAGNSMDEAVIYTTNLEGPFDLVYIDGGHEYDTVMSDIKYYAEMTKKGGLLAIDDASCKLALPRNPDWFRGIDEVTQAVEDAVTPDDRFKELFAVGHNRVWRRTT